MFPVLCSWKYNLGTGALQRSSLRRLYINEGRYEEAANEMLRWVFCNGKRLRGLVLRRTDERALFLAGKVWHYVLEAKGYKGLKRGKIRRK